MTKKDKPVYAFRRRGNTLIPESAYDVRALDGIANDQRVKIEIKEFRNAGRNRAYWAMLHEVVKATEAALTPEKLHEVIKLETGHVDLVRLPTGVTVALPGSIAFDKLSEAEFVAFFESAERWLASNYGYVRQEQAA